MNEYKLRAGSREGENIIRLTGNLFSPASAPIQLNFHPLEIFGPEHTATSVRGHHAPNYVVQPAERVTIAGTGCRSQSHLTSSVGDKNLIQRRASFLPPSIPSIGILRWNEMRLASPSPCIPDGLATGAGKEIETICTDDGISLDDDPNITTEKHAMVRNWLIEPSPVSFSGYFLCFKESIN